MTRINITNWLLTFALIFSAFFGQDAFAKTVNAASCSSSAVQAAINSAAEGDTVIIPPGTCIWTSGVTISGKGITVNGSGAGRIVAFSSDILTIGTGSKTLNITSTLVSGSLAAISAGETLRISETGNRQNWMQGTVISFSSPTLTMNITSTGGACAIVAGTSPANCKRWLISTIPSTVLINNSSSAMFNVREDSSFHTNLSGFKIQEGTGAGDGIVFNAGGGKAIIIQNCWIEQGNGDSIFTNVSRGVVSNCSFDSSPFSMAPLAVHLQPFDQTAWTTTAFYGMNDPDGQHNFYIESSDFHGYLNATDNDEGARNVFRYNVMNNAGYGTHGVDTGLIGQRDFEYYNNVGNFNGYNDGTTFNLNWWMFVRGGGFVVHDNTLPPIVSTDYGTKLDIDMTEMALQRNAGPIPCWGQGTSGGADYPAPRQIGLGYVNGTGHDGKGSATYSLASFGYSASAYVGDPEPAYIWANSRQPLSNVGTSDYGSGNADSCGGSTDTTANYIRINRDYFNGSTAKPGYTPYTYPHPLVTLTQTSGDLPAAPTNLRFVVE